MRKCLWLIDGEWKPLAANASQLPSWAFAIHSQNRWTRKNLSGRTPKVRRRFHERAGWSETLLIAYDAKCTFFHAKPKYAYKETGWRENQPCSLIEHERSRLELWFPHSLYEIEFDHFQLVLNERWDAWLNCGCTGWPGSLMIAYLIWRFLLKSRYIDKDPIRNP